ncbi:MAG: tRNA pseudouridine(38-40) synthase TruA [Alphaproteobacteria bacterium]
MARYKLTLEYDGTNFAGWQRQEDGVTTVQGVLEQAIARFTGEQVTLHVAGRTDAGVHAVGQVAHGDLTRADVTPETMRDAVNFHVRPHRVAVLAAEAVDENFHARFSATARAYRYVILNRRAPPVLDAAFVWHIQRPLDAAAMQMAASTLLGQHDFSTFRAQHCQAQSPVKTLDTLTVTRDGEKVIISARARSFLYHQVRNMVGTLALIGQGQWSQEDFIRAFAACDRTQGGPTAPAQGLCFLGPTYGCG